MAGLRAVLLASCCSRHAIAQSIVFTNFFSFVCAALAGLGAVLLATCCSRHACTQHHAHISLCILTHARKHTHLDAGKLSHEDFQALAYHHAAPKTSMQKHRQLTVFEQDWGTMAVTSLSVWASAYVHAGMACSGGSHLRLLPWSEIGARI